MNNFRHTCRILTTFLFSFVAFLNFCFCSTDISESKLKYLIKHDCGSCHGMRLTGGLGSPLHQLGGRSKKEIQMIILNGRPGTAMPAWKSLLSEKESEWIATFLISNSNTDFKNILQ